MLKHCEKQVMAILNGCGVRMVISPTWAWYDRAGGVAYLNSFNSELDTPAFVVYRMDW